MNLKPLTQLSGVLSLKQLTAQVRVGLNLPGAPAGFEVKIYELATGGYEAIASHTPVLKAGTPRPGAAPLRPGMPAARPTPAVAARPGMPTGRALPARPEPPPIRRAEPGLPTPEQALEAALKLIMAQAALLPALDWEPRPEF